jgi:hypothetical protein
MTSLESLLLELIPVRLPPAGPQDGPTARWLTEHPDDTPLAEVRHLPDRVSA